MVRKTLFLVVLLPVLLQGQDLKSHQWKQRILLLISTKKGEEQLEEQKTLLTHDIAAIRERKIALYQVTPSTYCKNINNCQPQPSKKLFERFSNLETPFKLFLIGLDGKVKFSDQNVTAPTELFKIIDKMPMRKQELVNEIDFDE